MLATLPAKLSRYPGVATLLLKHRGALDDPRPDDAEHLARDLGMVGQLSPRMQDRLLELLLEVADGRPDEVADVVIELGERGEGFAESALRRNVAELVARYQRATLADVGQRHPA